MREEDGGKLWSMRDGAALAEFVIEIARGCNVLNTRALLRREVLAAVHGKEILILEFADTGVAV